MPALVQAADEVAHGAEDLHAGGVLQRRQQREALACKRRADDGDVVMRVLQHADGRGVGLVADEQREARGLGGGGGAREQP